ncbi:hypothetical protein XENORESO_004854, partial [Xenotaenia resolanae]
NPDGDVQPWCYIADHEDVTYWKYCDIPTCQSKRLPLLSHLSHLSLGAYCGHADQPFFFLSLTSSSHLP